MSFLRFRSDVRQSMTFLDVTTNRIKKLKESCLNLRGSRKLVLVIVFIAIFLDNMLLTTVGQYSHIRRFTCFSGA